MSRDDSDLATMLEGTALGSAPTKGGGGLKGKLRRALSLGAAQALTEEDEGEGGKPSSGSGATPSPSPGAGASPADGDPSSTTPTGGTTTKKRSRAASLFNTRLNASTDNISLSSTMSSASMVIRKIGSIGKLARRNSLAGITSLFKDKNRDRDNGDATTSAGDVEDTPAGKKKGKSKRNKDSSGGSGKGAVVQPTISHAIAELDRTGGEWSDASMSGLSPAAKLVRQHTLRERAREAEAQAQAQAQAQTQANGTGANAVNGVNAPNGTGVPVPTTWEKNTTSRRDGARVRRGGVGEDGRVVVEDDSDSGSDVDHPGYSHGSAQQRNYISEGWEDDEVWREEDDEGDEDVTVRAPIGAGMHTDTGIGEDEEVAEWARTMRRAMECTRPAKGILKGASPFSASAHGW